MENIYKTVTTRVPTGELKFFWKDPNSDWSAELHINETGSPTYASYGSMHGWCEVSKNDPRFDNAVFQVLDSFFKHDILEFKKIRNHLNPEYRKMAEEIRMSALRKYDF